MEYKINPFPAVRVNWKKGRFSPRAINYHNNMNNLRDIIDLWEYTRQEVVEALIYGKYSLIFIIKIPDTWSKKKKEEMNWKPHRQSPDTDNLFKAFTDTVFYKNERNDKEVYSIKARKYWGTEWKITFEIW